MGDISEMRGLIVCVTFIATAITLILLIPAAMLTGSTGSPTGQINPKTGAFDILGYNDTYMWNFIGNNATLIGDTFVPNYGVHAFPVVVLGGRQLLVVESWFTRNESGLIAAKWCVQIEIADEFWGFRFHREDFRWINVNGSDVTSTVNMTCINGFWSPTDIQQHDVLTLVQLDTDSRRGDTYTVYSPEVSYTLHSSKCSIHIQFSYNGSAYDYPTQAYEQSVAGNGLHMSIGIDFNERYSQINAWTLILSILSFQTIPDLEPTMSILISSPIWICEGYLAFIFALRIIGAVFGGGGA